MALKPNIRSLNNKQQTVPDASTPTATEATAGTKTKEKKKPRTTKAAHWMSQNQKLTQMEKPTLLFAINTELIVLPQPLQHPLNPAGTLPGCSKS